MRAQRTPSEQRRGEFGLLAIAALAVLVFMGYAGSPGGPAPVHAAVIEVDSEADNDTADDDECTLREAINNANSDSDTTTGDCEAGTGVDSIVFADGVTLITLASPLPALSDADELTIDGGGDVTISGNDQHRVLWVGTDATVVLNGLTVRDGFTDDEAEEQFNGGGILNQGDLTLNNTTVTENFSDSNGGGIYSTGDFQGSSASLALVGSTVSNNESGLDSSGNGAGIYVSDSALIIEASVIAGNTAFFGGNGGGVYGSSGVGVFAISGSTISNNLAGNDGGGIRTISPTTIENSTISGNRANDRGGGIWNGGELSIENTTIDNNLANFSGENDGSGGGIYNSETLIMLNSTVSSNSAFAGGGIYNTETSEPEATVSLTHVTIAFNTSSDAGSNSGIHNASGVADNVVLRNTLLTGNTVDCSGPVTSEGNNLDSDGSCLLTATGDISGGDANLDALADNGGPTSTHALLPGSDAIDAVLNNTNCVATDQRGVTRPQDGDLDGTEVCDIGAFEVAFAALSVTKVCPTGTGDATFTIIVGADARIYGCGTTISYAGLAAGTLSITEVIGGPNFNSYVTSIACDSGENASGTSLDVTLTFGADVSCTVTNIFTGTPGGLTPEELADLLNVLNLDLEIDIENELNNINQNVNTNGNANTNNNGNTNTQGQTNGQDSNVSTGDVNVSSGGGSGTGTGTGTGN